MPPEPILPKIVARIVFEIVGNPKKHVVDSLHNYLERIKADPTIVWSDEFIAEANEQDGVWSTFAEATVTVKGLEKLNWLCVNFSPASVEIIEPAHLTITDKNITDWLNDLLSRIHEIGIQAKNVNAENELLKINMNNLIRNSIIIVLKQGKSLGAKEIAQELGIGDASVLQPFFDAMKKEERIAQKDDQYVLL
jgi:hypothetical protein